MATFKRIVFATDFSDAAESARVWAQRLAEYHGAKLHLLHIKVVLQPDMIPVGFTTTPDQLEEKREANARKKLEKLASGIGDNVTVAVESDFKAAPAIARYAEQQHADLVVVGSHGYSGLKRVVLGSETHDLLRVVGVPVLVIRPDTGTPPATGKPVFRRILAPVDLSQASAGALRFAEQLADDYGAELKVIHAAVVPVSPYYPQMYAGIRDTEIHDAMQRFLQDVGLKRDVKPYVINAGSAAYPIVDTAGEQKTDLILMSRSGLSGWQRFLVGNITEKVLHTAPCSVLVLPSADDSYR